MGLSFITEGAIPFAAADPLRVIPSMMVGSGVAGALALSLGSKLMRHMAVSLLYLRQTLVIFYKHCLH